MKRAVLIALAGALAGCSAGSNPGALPHSDGFNRTANVAFTMKWPTPGSAASRRPHFVSPSTQSVIIEVNGDASHTTFANAPQNGGTSTVAIDAPVGQDSFVISLYDQPQTPGETSAVGNELGQAAVSQTIESGKTNVVNATVSGIVSRVAVAAAPNQPYIESLQSGGFTLVGDAPQIFTATALDADGNVIVPAPALTITVPAYDNNPPIGTTFFAVNPVAGHPDEFAVNATTPDEAGIFAANTTMTAIAKDDLGNTASTIYPLVQSSAFFVSYGSSISGAAPIAVFDGSGNAVTPAGGFAGLQNPVALAYDHDDQRLYVADSGLGQLLAFNADGTPVSGFPLTQVPGANGVAYDSNNRLVYVSGANQVVAFTTDGKPVSTGGFQYTNHPSSVAYISGPYIMVGSSDSGTIDVYDESGNWIQNFAAGFTATTGMSADPKVNDVFIAGKPARGGNSVIRAYTYGYIEGGVSVTDPHGLAYDAIDDRLYAVSGSGNSIVPVPAWPTLGPVDSADAIVTPASSGLSLPSGLAITY
jgi:hypothetical protein